MQGRLLELRKYVDLDQWLCKLHNMHGFLNVVCNLDD